VLRAGEQVQGRRAHGSLERGVESPEGVANPRARRTSPEGASSPRTGRRLARGGDQPLSEAEPHPRGQPALERGGVSLVRRCAPRAKRSFARGWLGRLPWWAAGTTRAVGSCHLGCDRFERVLGLRIVCVLFFSERKWVSPGFLGTPTAVPDNNHVIQNHRRN
jgi:hypothetical protein